PKDAAAARRALLSSQSAADEAALADWRWTEILAPLMPPKSAPDSAPAVDFKSALVFAGLPADLLPSSLSTGSWRLELAACAGSRMYGLSTPQSDVDYLLIEFGCCEAAEFARQLLRGSIVQLELLFAQPAARLFVSPAFDWLLQRRMRLATENFIRQLLGLATEARKVGKAAYQLEHKLNLLTDLAAGIEPRVTLEGAERERVLALRSADWADPASRRALARASLDRHRAVKQTLASRSSRLAENCPTDFLTDWLQVVHFGSHISEAES
uniref:NTP_transf_2 domain-containing protein n=1 Tax=Macrostomum lignano TaxID=282301 RepID=A0A1I8IFJ6_9PLAT